MFIMKSASGIVSCSVRDGIFVLGHEECRQPQLFIIDGSLEIDPGTSFYWGRI